MPVKSIVHVLKKWVKNKDTTNLPVLQEITRSYLLEIQQKGLVVIQLLSMPDYLHLRPALGRDLVSMTLEAMRGFRNSQGVQAEVKLTTK